MIGGPQATIFPDDVIANPEVDVVIIGEAEISTTTLACTVKEKGSLRSVKGIVYRDVTGEVVRTDPQPLIQNLRPVRLNV